MSDPVRESGSVVELRVLEAHAGQRLDHVLAAHLSDRTRSAIQRLIKQGFARVDDVAAPARARVRAGQRITLVIPPPAPAEPRAEALDLDIVYDDSDLLVVDKPAGMVVHPGAGHATGTLVNALLHHVRDLSGVGGEIRPGIVHRLDRGTSGLMVIAKHDRAHNALARQFRQRTVAKRYTALAWGTMQAGRTIDLPIGRDPVRRQRLSTRAPRARDAVTHVLDVQPLPGCSLLTVSIATGRTHQIRVHLSAIGHPVVGDRVYGVPRRVSPPLAHLLSMKRPFLHARSLAFRHPADDRELRFESRLPAELEQVLIRLRAIDAVQPGCG